MTVFCILFGGLILCLPIGIITSCIMEDRVRKQKKEERENKRQYMGTHCT